MSVQAWSVRFKSLSCVNGGRIPGQRGEWHDFVDQPILHCLVGLDPLAGQDQCHRDAMRQLTDCPVHNECFVGEISFSRIPKIRCFARASSG